MQLVDAALWFSLARKTPRLNVWISKYVIPFILTLELLVAYAGGVWVSGTRWRLYEILLALCVVGATYAWVSRCGKDGTGVTTDGFLLWCQKEVSDPAKIGFFLFLALPFVMHYPPCLEKMILLAVGLGTFLDNYHRRAFGSRWCWAANVLSLVLAGISLKT